MAKPVQGSGNGGYVAESSRGGLVLMGDVSETVLRTHYVCPAVGSSDTHRLVRTKKGMRVITATIRQGVSAAGGSTAVWTIGDTATNSGFLASTSCVQVAGTITDGTGTYVSGRAGKLYTDVEDVNLYYTPGGAAGVTAPTCDVRLVIQHEWPEV